MARGEGEIGGTRDTPSQTAEEAFVNFRTAKVLPFSARQGTETAGEDVPLVPHPTTPHLSDPLGMSALVLELERTVAAAAKAAVTAQKQSAPESRPKAAAE